MNYPSVTREKMNRWDDYVYRVVLPVNPETPVVVMHFGVEQLDMGVSGTYDSVDALPDWMKERLAILMMTHEEFPTVEIPTVGRRISSNVFWVFAPSAPKEISYVQTPRIFPQHAPSIDILIIIASNLKLKP